MRFQHFTEIDKFHWESSQIGTDLECIYLCRNQICNKYLWKLSLYICYHQHNRSESCIGNLSAHVICVLEFLNFQSWNIVSANRNKGQLNTLIRHTPSFTLYTQRFLFADHWSRNKPGASKCNRKRYVYIFHLVNIRQHCHKAHTPKGEGIFSSLLFIYFFFSILW